MTVPEPLIWSGAIGGLTAAALVLCYWIYQCCANKTIKKHQDEQVADIHTELDQILGRVEVLIDGNTQVERATMAAAKEATTAAVEAATRDALDIVTRQCEHGMEMSKELSQKMEQVVDSLSGIMLQATEHLCNSVRTAVGRAAGDATEKAHKTAQEQWEVAFNQMAAASSAATEHARVAGDACTKAAGEFQQLVIDTQDLTTAAVNDISSVQRTAQEAAALSTEAASTATSHMDRLTLVLKTTNTHTVDAVTAVKDAQDEMIRSIQSTMNDMNSRGAQQLDETMREVMQANVKTIDRTLRDLSDVAVTVKGLGQTRTQLDKAVAELKSVQKIQASVTTDYFNMAVQPRAEKRPIPTNDTVLSPTYRDAGANPFLPTPELSPREEARSHQTRELETVHEDTNDNKERESDLSVYEKV